MFLSQRENETRSVTGAQVGQVTVAGESAGVWLEGERRGVTVYAPGGYHWVPALGEEVLVLKTGERGEKPCALGVPAGGQGLKAGEVMISAGAAAIKLSPDGRVEITGELTVNGVSAVLREKEAEGC